MKEAQPITRGIKNCRDSRLFKGCSPLQLLCNLIGNRPQSATFHTAKRYQTGQKLNSTELENNRSQNRPVNLSGEMNPRNQ